ncbi:MAG: response regulator [Alphaproteobacteria bacterium]|nr:response regulator [Alphaproteobacteria bacterium]
MQEGPDFNRSLLRLLSATFAFVLVTSLVLIGGISTTAVRSQNETAIRDSVHLVRSVVADREKRLSDQLLDYSYWDDAVLNLVSRFDPMWADKNVGLYMHDKFGISTSFVLDRDDRTVYAMVNGRRTQDDPRAYFSAGELEAILKKARSGSKTEPPMPKTGFLRNGGAAHIVAASVLTRFRKEGAVREKDEIATGSVLIFTQALDVKLLDEFSKRYLLEDLRLVSGESDLLSASLPLTTVDGTSLGYLTWRAKLPSEGAVHWLYLLFGGSLLVFSGAFYVFAKGVRSVFATMERSHAEQQWLQEKIRQDQKMKDLGLMAGGVAHEFNNLFQGITAHLELMQQKGMGPAEQKQMISVVLEGVFRGGELTDRLLSYAGRKKANPVLVRLEDYLKDIVEFVRPILPETIKVEGPAATKSWPVRIDVSQLRASVINLFLNARDAMFNGGLIRVDVANVSLGPAAIRGWSSEVTPGDYVCVMVADNGQGIPPDVLKRVMQPFYTTKEVGKGMGLGLSMVYGFVTQSGGYLKIDSAVGRGTEVRIFFPRVPESEIDDADLGAEIEEDERMAEEKKKTILYVEDDAHVRNALLKVLSLFGYRVLSAENAIEASKLLESGATFDLLLSDIVMPGGMSGVDLADKVRKTRPEIPILLITAYSDEELRRQAINGLGYKVLRKPVQIRALAEAIEKSLGEAA